MKKAPGVNRGQLLFGWVAIRFAERHVCCVLVSWPISSQALLPGRPFNQGTNYKWCTDCTKGEH